MRQFVIILGILLCTNTFAENTVQETETEKSKSAIALFDKACLNAYLDNDELASFLLENPFEDLNNNTHKKNNKENKNEKNHESDEGTDEQTKHYAINHNKTRYLLEISDQSCSISLKNINNDIFNSEFKTFKKTLFDPTITEEAKSYEQRKGSENYKLTTYKFTSDDDDVILPFKIMVGQTNSTHTSFQVKLTLQLDKKKEAEQLDNNF